MEGATQKSLDEEVKSADNIPIEPISLKPKTVDEDQVISTDAQPSTNLIKTLIKKDSKLNNLEETKEKCSCSTGANATQNEQSVNAQEKDVVDSVVEVATVTPQESENATPNDKTNGI